MIPWIMIMILVFLVILAILAIYSRRIKKRPTDYYAFFIIGIIWTLVGLIPTNRFFLIMGLAFMAIGLVHKKEWKKNRVTWKKMTKEERKFKMILMIALGVFLLLGVLVLFLAKSF